MNKLERALLEKSREALLGAIEQAIRDALPPDHTSWSCWPGANALSRKVYNAVLKELE